MLDHFQVICFIYFSYIIIILTASGWHYFSDIPWGPLSLCRKAVQTASNFAKREEKFQKTIKPSWDLNGGSPGRRACALPQDHGDPPLFWDIIFLVLWSPKGTCLSTPKQISVLLFEIKLVRLRYKRIHFIHHWDSNTFKITTILIPYFDLQSGEQLFHCKNTMRSLNFSPECCKLLGIWHF